MLRGVKLKPLPWIISADQKFKLDGFYIPVVGPNIFKVRSSDRAISLQFDL